MTPFPGGCWVLAAALFLAVAVPAGPSGAQQRSDLRLSVRGDGPRFAVLAAAQVDPGEGESFVASLAVPGLAQYRHGQRRWLVYAGLEALSVLYYVGARADALGLIDEYRDFAWVTARENVGVGPRKDGDFDYYERLAQWGTSGRWDADPSFVGLQPENNPATYNGSIWLLASQIFNLDPDAPQQSPGYSRALDYYRMHGYGPEFLWSWPADSDDRSRYSALISKSDSRFKDARIALGVLAANHLCSALDGFITARLRALPEGRGVEFAFSLPARP